MSLPRDLIEQDWFRTVATYNPVSYLFEGVRSLIITGWDARALALGLRLRARRSPPLGVLGAGLRRCGRGWCAREPLRRRRAGRGLAPRSTTSSRNPALLLPSLIFPLFFFTAFAGGLSSVGNVPGFDFPSGYTAFQFVFVLLQAAAFGGVFTGFSIAVGLRARASRAG